MTANIPHPTGAIPAVAKAQEKADKAAAVAQAADAALAEAAAFERAWQARLADLSRLAAKIQYARGQQAHWGSFIPGTEAQLQESDTLGSPANGQFLQPALGVATQLAGLRELATQVEKFLATHTAEFERQLADAEKFATANGIKDWPRPAI